MKFLSTNGWHDGIRSYTQPLSWDAGQEVLSPGTNANGESVLAFFNIPNGYNEAVDDAVEFAFGVTAIPEPSTSALVIAAVGFMLGKERRRKRG